MILFKYAVDNEVLKKEISTIEKQINKFLPDFSYIDHQQLFGTKIKNYIPYQANYYEDFSYNAHDFLMGRYYYHSDAYLPQMQ